jgi:hypothetical protein
VELDAAAAGGVGPGELPGVPFDEGFGFRRDVEVLVEPGVRLADLGVSVLDQQPEPLVAGAAGEVEADDDASVREPVSSQRVLRFLSQPDPSGVSPTMVVAVKGVALAIGIVGLVSALRSPSDRPA